MSQKKPYSEAVSTGQYVKKTGLSGKYDNVRRFWEDEATRLFLRPYIKAIVDAKTARLERLKILDIGCGAGDGFDLLMGMTAKDRGIFEYAVELINPEMLGLYLGIDINQNLLRQAREFCGQNGKISFREGDFTKSLPTGEGPFDIYFTSYGTLSHNHDAQTVELLADIARNCRDSTLVIGDWLGRYSYEWQDLWVGEPLPETFMDYRISYIYPPEERQNAEIAAFPLRLASREEICGLIDKASELAGRKILVRKIFDRSLFVGRHMDTGEYNSHCPPMREVVNSLIEPNVRTDLAGLIIDYFPRTGFDRLNAFFDGFSMCWNTLVRHTLEFLSDFGEKPVSRDNIEERCMFYPEPLRHAVLTMRKVIDATGLLPGDTRANIIEPQLAYALRKLEMDMQPGAGVGHGLIAILEINPQ